MSRFPPFDEQLAAIPRGQPGNDLFMSTQPYVRFWIEEKLADGRWVGPENGLGQGYSYVTREQAESEAKRIFHWRKLGEDLRVVRIES